MAGHLIDTPRTEAGDQTRFTVNADFSELPSFLPPPGRDELMPAVRGQKNGSFATPRARVPLANRSRNAQSKNEFTPLLQSAARNRFLLRDQESKENHGGLVTPAVLKGGYTYSSPMPEASSLMNSSMSSDHTPMAHLNGSSSPASTLMAMPSGELGIGGDGGNVLTLREQEEVGL